ncbi:MAG: GDP-mannose 4,6-dehydratase [Bryobacteraceae bacterium]|nr:GDP-mannose 4,6-dehydratase [Bryobacteraceae bacterium]
MGSNTNNAGRVLVTGGAGFIGFHACKLLLGRGHRVLCVDNFDAYYDPAIKRANAAELSQHPNFQLLEGDIRDRDLLRRAFQPNVDRMLHLAARAGVRPSIANPQLYFDVNVGGTLEILESMRQYGCTKLVFASSSSVYGNSPRIPFSEDDASAEPISPYAASKRAAELLCYSYHHLYRFDISCLRFFTVYGPRQRPEMAISLFTDRIRKGEPVEMFGDGATVRDYTFIDDITAGIEAALQRVSGFAIYNLGGSRTTSLRQTIAAIEDALGRRAIIRQLPMQSGDVDRTFADISKARRELGYQPNTPFPEGIRIFCEWLTRTKPLAAVTP